MSVADIKKSAEQKMQKSIDAFKADLAKVRTGRAHTGLLDHVQVDYYGSMVPISQVANLAWPMHVRSVCSRGKRRWCRPSKGPSATRTWA